MAGQPTIADLQNQLREIQNQLSELVQIGHNFVSAPEPTSGMPFVGLFTIFLLACFVGYYVVWHVTPALHSPLMSVTNAISSVIIVGAIIAAGPGDYSLSSWFGFAAVILAGVNIFGGFIVTQRMLAMFKKKPSQPSQPSQPSGADSASENVLKEASFLEKMKNMLFSKGEKS